MEPTGIVIIPISRPLAKYGRSSLSIRLRPTGMENTSVLPSMEATIKPEYSPACSLVERDIES